MELHSREPLILEFNGLPGSGKTTITNKILEINDGGTVKYITTYNKNFLSSYLKSSWFNYGCLQFNRVLSPFLSAYNYHKTSLRDDRLLLLYFFRQYYNYIHSGKYEILIVDQGIIQALLSVAHNSLIKDLALLGSIVEFLADKGVRFIRVNCISNVLLSDIRVKQRPSNHSRLDLMQEEDLRQTLNIQAKNLEMIRECFNRHPFYKELMVSVDTEKSIEDNALFINNIVDDIVTNR